MSHHSVVDEIEAVMGVDFDHPLTTPIAQEQIKSWMQTEDVEGQGAVFALLMKPHHAKRIAPPMTFDDYHHFVMRYYERCFRENPDGEWADSRYSAGRSLVNWFIGNWNKSEVPRSAFADLKAWLETLYIKGDQELRICLVTATFEHLFENKKIAKYFSDWEKDPVLKVAYEEAMRWQEKESRKE